MHACVGEGNGPPLQCSCLENPMGGGAWWAAVHGVTKSRTERLHFHFSLSCIGVGCHFLPQFMKVKSESEVAQCPTLCDPMDSSLPGSSTHGIFQARVLEWVTIAVSVYTGRRILHYCAIWEAHTLTQFPIMVTSCKTVAQYHIQDVYTNSVKTKHFYQLQGPSCCPFITTPTSFFN